MNKKGFSLIEVMATFMLISVVLIMLVELLLSLKTIYKEGDLRTTLLINQANIEKRIYRDTFTDNNLNFDGCGTNCLNILTNSGTKTLKIEDNHIIYDGYIMNITNGSNIGELTFDTVNQTVNGNVISIYMIDLPVTNRLIDGDFGIHIVLQKGNELY